MARAQHDYDDIPGTFVFDAERSREGYGINMFCMSLMKEENRKAFKANEADYVKKFKLTPAQQFVKILFPAALPTIFVGVRLGLIFTLINVVGVEFLINFGGLGQLINDLAERYDLPGTYAAICFVILVSVVFFVITEWIERWLRRVD